MHADVYITSFFLWTNLKKLRLFTQHIEDTKQDVLIAKNWIVRIGYF